MGLKLEKDAVYTFTYPTWLMAMNFLMKNININYDFNTKFELTTVLNNTLWLQSWMPCVFSFYLIRCFFSHVKFILGVEGIIEIDRAQLVDWRVC